MALQRRVVVSVLALLSSSACSSVASSVLEDAGRLREQFSVSESRQRLANRNNQTPYNAVKNLGGQALSRPCCVATGPGLTDCFIRGPRSTVLQKTISKEDGGVDSDWEDIGGYGIGDLECLSRDASSIDIFALNADYNLIVNSYNAEAWAGWQDLDGISMEVPSCVSPNPSEIHCALRGTDNFAFHISHSNGAWGTYVKGKSNALMYPLGCGVHSSARVDCFAFSYGKSMYQLYQLDGWTEGKINNRPDRGRPSVVWTTPLNPYRVDVFALGIDNDVVQETNSGGWQVSTSLGGVFGSDPECLALGQNQLHCFAVGMDSWLYHNRLVFKSQWHGTQWWGWTKRDQDGSSYIGTPSCIADNANEISCFVRNVKHEVVQLMYTFENEDSFG